jgi:hypothetical protein
MFELDVFMISIIGNDAVAEPGTPPPLVALVENP